MTTASDNFAGANASPVGAPWSSCYGGGANKVSNALTSVAGVDKGSIFPASWGNDQEVTWTVGNLSVNANYSAGLLRGDVSGNAFSIYTDGQSGAGHTGLVLFTAGTAGAELGSWAVTFANGDQARAKITGASPNIVVELWKNGTSQGQVTGLTGPAGGAPGGGAFGAGTVTAWSATDNAGAFKAAFAQGANPPIVWRGDMFKNEASQIIGAQLINATDGTPYTGAASVAITKDAGTQAAGAGTAPAHEGNGFHTYSPTAAETNGDHLAFTFTGTGAVPVTVQVYTSDKVAYDALNAAARVIGIATVGSGATTTSIPLSAINVGGLASVGADALAGSMLEVRGDTPTTTSLGGKKVAIASNTSGSTPTLTLSTALATAPVAGDLVVIG